MYVCLNCFGDPGMVQFVEDSAVSDECSYCSSSSSVPIAAPIDAVADHFIDCIHQEYDDAANQLGWDGSEGGYQGAYWDSFELTSDVLGLDFPQGNWDVLLPELFSNRLDQLWCEADAYGLNDEEKISFSWEKFCNTIMHERRFFFLDYDPDPFDREAYRASQVLRKVFEYAQLIDLIKPLPSGTKLCRARWEGCRPHLQTPQELGPPPPKMATQSNRMSPAGISMFYACDEQQTALAETKEGPGYFALGQFETLRAATLLDLCDIPPVPSLFQPTSENLEFRPREVLTFLNHVRRQMSRRIDRSGRSHFEYAPTQVVTEFIRTQLTRDNMSVEGIRYPSSIEPGGVVYVIFAGQHNVVGGQGRDFTDDRWLKLTAVEHVRLDH